MGSVLPVTQSFLHNMLDGRALPQLTLTQVLLLLWCNPDALGVATLYVIRVTQHCTVHTLCAAASYSYSL